MSGLSLKRTLDCPYSTANTTWSWGWRIVENSRYFITSCYRFSSNQGRVFVYDKFPSNGSSTWSLILQLTDHVSSFYDANFGSGLALDKDFLYVGSPEEHFTQLAHVDYPDVGRVYVYSMNANIAPIGTFISYITTPEYDTFYTNAYSEMHDNFGGGIEVLHDKIFISSPYAESGSTNGVGTTHIFQKVFDNTAPYKYTFPYTGVKQTHTTKSGASSIYNYGGMHAKTWTNYNKNFHIVGTEAKSPTLGGQYRPGEILSYVYGTNQIDWYRMHPYQGLIFDKYAGDFGRYFGVCEYYVVTGSTHFEANGQLYRGLAWILDINTGEIVHELEPPPEDADVAFFGTAATCSEGVAFIANHAYDNFTGVVYYYNLHDGAYLGKLSPPSSVYGHRYFGGGIRGGNSGNTGYNEYTALQVVGDTLYVTAERMTSETTYVDTVYMYTIPPGYGSPPGDFWEVTRGAIQRTIL